MGSYAVSSTVVLAVMCVGAWGLLRLVRRRGATGPLRVRARLGLEPRRSLYVIEAGGRCFLVGVGEGPMSMLAELDPATLAAPTETEVARTEAAQSRESAAQSRESAAQSRESGAASSDSAVATIEENRRQATGDGRQAMDRAPRPPGRNQRWRRPDPSNPEPQSPNTKDPDNGCLGESPWRSLSVPGPLAIASSEVSSAASAASSPGVPTPSRSVWARALRRLVDGAGR